MFAHFTAAVMNSNRQSNKAKKWKPADLFDREKKERIMRTRPEVVDINERRQAFKLVKGDGPPKLPNKRS